MKHDGLNVQSGLSGFVMMRIGLAVIRSGDLFVGWIGKQMTNWQKECEELLKPTKNIRCNCCVNITRLARAFLKLAEDAERSADDMGVDDEWIQYIWDKTREPQ